jgi:translation elongation factor EF-Tu-like GTPase
MQTIAPAHVRSKGRGSTPPHIGAPFCANFAQKSFSAAQAQRAISVVDARAGDAPGALPSAPDEVEAGQG